RKRGEMDRISKNDLIGIQPTRDSLVGVDSDGCVFDTMGVKQIRHFHPLILRFWNLEPAEKEFRETAEFVNLRSRWRGSNRFPALLKTFELFSTRADVRALNLPLPVLEPLQSYVESGLPLGNPSLAQEVERTGDAELRRLLDWSRAVDREIAENMKPVPPFRGVREALERMRGRSDVLVVSQTPEPALVHEWTLHGLRPLVRQIAGQELGTKAEHLRMASAGKYAADRVLMIGDAPGDLQAARETGAFFFPVFPGREEESWSELFSEGYDRFLEGRFGGDYQDRMIRAFEALLPDVPPWMPESQKRS
ncbi:MAG: HAD hydrolase-like protein, partial [Kiritimatiellia bacterium]|nr:HAD hydrolase-like protein [Kiritimatiellia bacterium]